MLKFKSSELILLFYDGTIKLILSLRQIVFLLKKI